jgi:hypothetical protein
MYRRHKVLDLVYFFCVFKTVSARVKRISSEIRIIDRCIVGSVRCVWLLTVTCVDAKGQMTVSKTIEVTELNETASEVSICRGKKLHKKHKT